MDLIFVAFLVLPSVINAAVCPSSLYFFASDNVDNRVTFARTNATSFEDCIRKCYASDFCFSVVFNPAPLDSNLASECRLSYVSAFICTSKTLVNSHPNPTRPFIAECLKCPALGENSNRSFTVSLFSLIALLLFLAPQTISEFAEFTVNGANVSATVTTARSSASFNNISAKITESDIGPNSNVTTLSTSSTSQSASVTTALNENLSASDLRNTGNIFQTSTAAGALRACSNLTFEIVEIDKDEVPTSKQLASEFQNIISSSSVSDCAKKCYERQCAHAIYVQPLDSDIGQCYVNFNGTEVCSASKRITNYTLGEATHIRVRCLQCKPSQVVIQPSIGNNPVSQNVAAESPRICSGTLTFNVLDPAPSRALAFSNHSQAESADECAKLCYERRCTIAGFAPPVDINSKGSCLFSYGLDQCTTENSLSHYAAKGLVQIECLKCAETTQSSLNLSIATSSALPTSTTTRVSSLSANVSETTQAISTSTSSSQLPLINSSIPLAETTQSSTVPQSTTKQSTTNSSSPSSAIPSISSSNLPESSSSSSTSLSTETSIAHSSTVASNGPTSSSLASISSTVQSSSTVQLSSTEQSSSTSASLLPEISASLSIITNSNSTSNVTETSSVVPPLSSSTLHELSTSHSSAFASNSTANLSETTREKVEGFPSPKPVDGFNDQTCQQLSFEPRKPDFDINLNFTQQVSSQFIEECAKLCFLSNCTTATFLPSQNSLTSKGSCYFSFDPVECSTTVARKVNFFDFAEPIPIVLHCVRCEDELKKLESNFLPVIQNPPSVVPKGPIAQLNSSELTSNATSQHPNAVEETTRTAAEISSSLAFHSSTSSLSSQSSHSTSSLPTQSSQSSSSLSTSSQSSIPLTSSFHSTSLESSQSTSSSSTFISASSHSEITTHSSSSTVSPISLGTTKIASTNAPKFCIGEITFQSRIPSPDRIYSHSINLNFSSPGECVRVCFEKSCTMVSYIKSAIPEESDICLLGFDSEVCDTNAPRSSNHTGRFPAEFHCIRCDATNALNKILRSNRCKQLNFELRDPTPYSFHNLSQEVLIDDPYQCAQLCYAANCTTAIFKPNLDSSELKPRGTCVLAYDPQVCLSNETTVPSIRNDLPAAMHCITCKELWQDDSLSFQLLNSSNSSTTCKGLSFLPKDPRLDYPLTFTFYIPSQSAHECAQLCFLANCTTAAFLPKRGSVSQGVCHFSFDSEQCNTENTSPVNWQLYTKPVAVVMHCIHCATSDVKLSVIRQDALHKSTLLKESRILSKEPKAFTNIPICQKLTFEPMDPFLDPSLNFSREIETDNADDCAQLCYLSRCTTVGYLPNEDPTVKRGICFMLFDPDFCPSTVKRVSTFKKRDAIVLRCIKCEDKNESTHETVQMKLDPGRCHSLHFFPGGLLDDTFYNFTTRIATTSIKQCGELCYMANCTTAAFTVIHKSSLKVEGVCDMSFERGDCPTKGSGALTLNEALEAPVSFIMRCIYCENQTQSKPNFFTRQFSITTPATTAKVVEVSTKGNVSSQFQVDSASQVNFSAVPFCNNITFEARAANMDFAASFSNEILSSKNAEECAYQCYLNQCSYAGYTQLVQKTDLLPSSGLCFFFFTPETCGTNNQFRTSKVVTDRSVSMHCIRCEDNSSLVPLPRQELRKRQQLLEIAGKTTKAPTCGGKLTFRPGNPSYDIRLNFTRFMVSSDPEDCVQQCYDNKCTSAGFVPNDEPDEPGNGTCFISYTDSLCSTSAKNENRASKINKLVYVVLHCIECEDGKQSNRSIGTQSVEKRVDSEPKSAALRKCSNLTYQVSKTVNESLLFTQELASRDVTDCARLCYLAGCASARFKPSDHSAVGSSQRLDIQEVGTCYLSFDEIQCFSTKVINGPNENSSHPVFIRCVRCDDNQPKSSLPKENSLAAAGNPIGFELPLETSQAPIAPVKEVEKNFIRLRPCIAEITFEISPQLEVDEKSYLTNSSVKDAEECAKECFERNCTLARYLVENLLGSPINCLFSFESDKCTGGKRVSNYSDILPVTLHCIQCVAEQVDDKSKAAFIKSNQVSKIEVINQTEAKEFSVTSTVASSTVPATSKEVTLASTTSLHAIPINSSSSSIETSSTSPLLIISVSTVQPRETSIGRKVQAISESSTTIVLSHSSVAINATISSVESSHVTVPNVNESYSSTHETTASSTSQPSTTLANIDETDLGEINSTDGFFVVGNCTVLFEAHEPNPNIPFNWINRTAGFSLPECAAQCYLDGCNAVSYKPFEGDEKDICLFSFGPEQCNGDDKISYIPEKYPVLIQCVRCVNGFHLLTPAPRRNNTTTRPSTTIGNKVAIGNSSIQSEITTSKIESSTIKALLSQSTIEVGKETSVAPIQSSFHQPTPVKTVPTFSSPLLQLSTLAAQGPAIFSTVQQPAVVSAANSSLPIPDVKKPLAALPVIKDLQNQNAVPSRTASAPQPARAQTIPIPTGGSEQSTVEENVASEDEFVSRMTPAVIRTCWGHLRFYVEPMETFELQSTDYTFYTSTTTAEECASFCYRRACSSAQYIPINEEKQFGGKCRLRFTDVQCPSDIQGFVSNVATLLTSPIILRCITCVKPTTSESTFANQTSFVTPPQFLFPIKTPPSTERTCYNRVSFQIQPPISSIAVKFTVDMFVPSATDCAKACYSKHCEVAGYIPALNKEGSGVCLLSETKATCLANYPKQVEEIRTNPFILDCIECTPCNFTIRNINRSFLRNFEDRLKTASLTECAQMCHRRNCTSAAYFAQGSNDANCFLSNSLQENCNATDDRRQLNLISHIPVLLECVRCDADVN